MIQNLPERFLYARLPAAVVTGDERGLIDAVLGGFQDRLEDLRSFTRKVGDFYTPGALPDGVNNAVLVDVIGRQGKTYTRSLDFQPDTPPTNGVALTAWASQQLRLPLDAISNVRYGRDLLRLVDANVLAYLAATIGAVLYQSLVFTDEQQSAANVKLVDTWFPRLKIKGTAKSFEVLGRLLGFQDVRVTPLWTRLSPRNPDDVGDPANNPDFSSDADFYPAQTISARYNPFDYRDGPYFSWQTVVSNGTADAAFYTQSVTGFNPWVDVVMLGSLAGTNVPAVSFGSVTHPASGTYALAGGLPNFKAYIDPPGSSVRFQAISEGDGFNGLVVAVSTPGTLYNATGTVVTVAGSYANISIQDRLSSVKYRSSYFDIGLASSMDTLEEIFGSRAATTNKDLKADPQLTSDGTAVSPYRPWVGGSIAVQRAAQDWVTSTGSNVSTPRGRTEADPTVTRQLNVDAALAAGVQVIQAFEEVRPATRLPRRSQFGFLIDDKADYAAYVGTASPLFTTNGSTSVYAGSWPRTPAQSYPQAITAPLGDATLVSYPEQSQFDSSLFFYRFQQDAAGFNLFGTFQNGSYWFSGTSQSITLTGAFHTEYNKTYVYTSGSYVSGDQMLFLHGGLWLAATGTFGYYSCDPSLFPVGPWDSTSGGTPPVGRYTFSGMVVSAVWQPFTTEVIREEPTLAEKTVGSGEGNAFPIYSAATRIQMRPEDDDASLLDVVDEFGWRREVVAGGELEDLDMYFSGTEFAIDPVDAATVFNDHTGVDLNVHGIIGQSTPMRVVIEPRPVDDTYLPGNLPIGYQGVLKDLATLTSADTSVIKLPSGTVSKGDTATQYDSAFQPGFSLFHVGIAQGVMVADLPVFFGPHHRDNLVGWFALNEHPEGDLSPVDHSAVNSGLADVNVPSTARVWDEVRGWCLTMSQSGLNSAAYRGIEHEATMSFWMKVLVAPTDAEQVVSVGPLSVLCSSTLLSAYVKGPRGTPHLIGTAPIGADWMFVYIRANATTAYANVSTLSALGTEATLSGDFIGVSPDNSVSVAASEATYLIHDLRVWNSTKTSAEMNKVRYHGPTPTLCTYPLGYITTVDRQDRYGIRVLTSGWAFPGVSLAGYKRSNQGLVRRYDSMGSYHGEDRYKETGIGDCRALPSVYKLGHQFTAMTSAGTAPFSTGVGQLPGVSNFWGSLSNGGSHALAGGTYAKLVYSALAVSQGTGFDATYVYSGTASPWPNDMDQTNPFREAIWALNKQDGYIYEVMLDATGTNVALTTQRVVRGRSQREALLDPFIGPLVQNGTLSAVVDGVYASGTVVGQAGTVHYASGSKVFQVADLYTSEQPTGAYVLDMASVTGAVAYNGTSALTSYYMYMNSRSNVKVANTFTVWTDANVATAQSNSVDYSAAPTIVYNTGSGVYLNTPVIGKAGQLEFQNTSNLLPGDYLLTVESANIGQPDPDFRGFDVDISVNSTTLSVRLLKGLSGYNVRGRDTIPITVTDGVNGNWLLSFDWTNALSDPSRGTKRQLAIYSYELRYLSTQAFRVDVADPSLSIAPVITALGTGTYSTGSGATPGGWFVALNSYGSAAGYQHESVVYSRSDTVANQMPVSNLLTSLTNERRSDVIYVGTDVLISDPGSYTYPTFYGGSVAADSAGLYQVGQTGTFTVSGYGSLSAIYSYVWRFWDATGTATPGPSVMKVINTGSNPMGTPNGLQVTCLPVAFDGQSVALVGTIRANNPPVILTGAFLTDNDDYYPYQTTAGFTAFDFDKDNVYFSWFAGTSFISHGTTTSAGPVSGTWHGNGTTVVGQFAGTNNALETTITSPEVLTCYVSDSRSGTNVLEFFMRGQPTPSPEASAGAGGTGLLADVSSIPSQRIGAGATVDFTVYAKDTAGGVLSFYWEFYGSNGWTMAPVQQTGTTSTLASGSVLNIVRRDISAEVIVSGTQKTATALCEVFATNPDHSRTQLTELSVEVTLVRSAALTATTVERSVDGNVVTGHGPVTGGQQLEFAVTGTDASGDWESFAWVFNQPFEPSKLLYWGAKVILDTTAYTTGQTITGQLTATDRLGGVYTQDLDSTTIQ